jgi:hypothetical protein
MKISAYIEGPKVIFDDKMPRKLVPPHGFGGFRHSVLLNYVPNSPYVKKKKHNPESGFRFRREYCLALFRQARKCSLQFALLYFYNK